MNDSNVEDETISNQLKTASDVMPLLKGGILSGRGKIKSMTSQLDSQIFKVRDESKNTFNVVNQNLLIEKQPEILTKNANLIYNKSLASTHNLWKNVDFRSAKQRKFTMKEQYCGKWSKREGYPIMLTPVNAQTASSQSMDADVYPFSVRRSEQDLNRMRFWRIFFLLLLFLALVINDIALRDKDNPSKFQYFYNRLVEKEIDISSLPASGLTFDLENCGIGFKTWSKADKIQIQSNTPIVVEPSYENGVYTAHDNNKNVVKCRILLTYPSSSTGTILPPLTINTKGEDVMQKLQIYDTLIPKGDYLNFGANNSFIFTGTLMYVHLYRAHKMKEFKAIFTKGGADIKGITASNVQIQLEEGTIQYASTENYTKVTATESNSQICISGQVVTPISSSSFCIADTATAKAIALPTTVPKSGDECVIVADVCYTGLCTGSPTSTVSLKVLDGSIQYAQTKKTANQTLQSKSLLRSHLEFNQKSFQRLSNIQVHVKNTPNEDILYILDVFMAGEKSVWMYSTKQAFIIARPWLLSIVSLTLINPKIERHQLYLSFSTCPGRSLGNPTLAKEIARELKSIIQPSTEKVIGIVVQKKEGSYLAYEEQEDDASVDREIQFTDGNYFMVSTLFYSLILSIMTGFMLMYSIMYLFRLIDHFYLSYLQTQMKLLKCKSETKSSQLQTREYTDHVRKNVLVKGFCKEKFKPKLNQKKETASTLQQSIVFRYGLFQLSSIYLDHLIRKHTWSLRKFLNVYIQESSSHFPNHDEAASSELQQSPYVKLNEFRSIYKKFCLKFGYTPEDIEEQEDLLENYGMQIETIQSGETQAYLQIRWKRSDEPIPISNEDDAQNQSAISQFIQTQCVQTRLDHDFILTSELQSQYEQYINKVYGFQKEYEPIAGSSELDKLGLKTKNVAIKVIRNVTKLNPIILESNKAFFNNQTQRLHFQTGLVRIPDTKYRPWYDPIKYLKKWSIIFWIKNHLFSSTGMIVNLANVVFHLALIAVIIIPINAGTSWMMLEETQYDSDPFQLGFDEQDIIYADYEHFWFTSLRTELRIYLICQLSFSVVFIIVAIVNLFFYYTSKMILQNYQVRRTACNSIFSYIFRIMLMILLYLYLVYVVLFLIWWMLGAIINPTKFLPYATTSISFISYVIYKYQNLKQFYKELEKAVAEKVTHHMVKMQKQVIQSVFKTDPKSQEGGDESLEGMVLNSGREIILFSFVSAFGKDINQLDKGLRKRLVSGDQDAQIELMSDVVGIHPIVSLACMGVIKKDKSLMLKSSEEMAKKFDISPHMCKTITEICIDEYVPGHFGVREPPKSAVMKIKPLFQIFFYNINSDLIEGILGIMLENNLSRMIEFIDKLNGKKKKLMPIELFHLISTLHSDRKDKGKYLKVICEQVLEDKCPNIHSLMKDLIDVHDREYYLKAPEKSQSKPQPQIPILIENLSKVKEEESKEHDDMVKVKPEDEESFHEGEESRNFSDDMFSQIYITPYMHNTRMKEYVIQKVIKLITKDLQSDMVDMDLDTLRKEMEFNYLKMFNYICSDTLDINRIGNFSMKRVNSRILTFEFKNLRNAATNSRSDFLKMIIKLDLAQQYELMNELFQLANNRHDKLINMSFTVNILKLPTHYASFLFQLIHFLASQDEKYKCDFDKQSPLYNEFANFKPYTGKILVKCRGKNAAAQLSSTHSQDQRMIMYQLYDQLSTSMIDSVISLSIILKGIKQKELQPSQIHPDYTRAVITIASSYMMEESQLSFIIDVLTGDPSRIFKKWIKAQQPKLPRELQIKKIDSDDEEEEKDGGEDEKSEGTTNEKESFMEPVQQVFEDEEEPTYDDDQCGFRVMFISKVLDIRVEDILEQGKQWKDEFTNIPNQIESDDGVATKEEINDIRLQLVNLSTQMKVQKFFTHISTLIQNQYNQQSKYQRHQVKNRVIQTLASNLSTYEMDVTILIQLLQCDLISLYQRVVHQESLKQVNKDLAEQEIQTVDQIRQLIKGAEYPVVALIYLIKLVDGEYPVPKSYVDLEIENQEEVKNETNFSYHSVAPTNGEKINVNGQPDMEFIKAKPKSIHKKFEEFMIILLLNHQMLAERFKSTQVDSSIFNTFKENLPNIIPSTHKEKIFNKVLDHEQIQSSLYKSGVFHDAGEKLFKLTKAELIQNPNIEESRNNFQAVFKLMYGKATQDVSMISSSLQELIYGCKDYFLFEGFLAILLKDFTKEQEIFYVSQKLDLNPAMLRTLLSVCSHDQNLIIKNIKASFSIKKPEIVASLLSLRMPKQSISLVANELKLDSITTNMVLSFGYRQKYKCKVYYQKLCDMYKFKSKEDIAALVELSQGYTNPVRYLKSNMRTFKYMSLKDTGLAESLVFIHTTGRQVRIAYENNTRGRRDYPNKSYSHYEAKKHLFRFTRAFFENTPQQDGTKQNQDEFIGILEALWHKTSYVQHEIDRQILIQSVMMFIGLIDENEDQYKNASHFLKLMEHFTKFGNGVILSRFMFKMMFGCIQLEDYELIKTLVRSDDRRDFNQDATYDIENTMTPNTPENKNQVKPSDRRDSFDSSYQDYVNQVPDEYQRTDVKLRHTCIAAILACANADWDAIQKYCNGLMDDLQFNFDVTSNKLIILYQITALSNTDYAYKQIGTDFQFFQHNDSRLLALHLLKNINANQLLNTLERYKKYHDNEALKINHEHEPILALLVNDLKIDYDSFYVLECLVKMVLGRFSSNDFDLDAITNKSEQIKDGQAQLYLQLCSENPSEFKSVVEAKISLEYPDLSQLVINLHEFIYGNEPEESIQNILFSPITKFYHIQRFKDSEDKKFLDSHDLIQKRLHMGYQLISQSYLDLNKEQQASFFEELAERFEISDQGLDEMKRKHKIMFNILRKTPWKAVQHISKDQHLKNYQTIVKSMIDYPLMSMIKSNNPNKKGLVEIFKNLLSKGDMETRYQNDAQMIFTMVLESYRGNIQSLFEVIDYFNNIDEKSTKTHFSCLFVYNILIQKSPLYLNFSHKHDDFNQLVSDIDHMKQASTMMRDFILPSRVTSKQVLHSLQQKYVYGLMYLLTVNVKYLYQIEHYYQEMPNIMQLQKEHKLFKVWVDTCKPSIEKKECLHLLLNPTHDKQDITELLNGFTETVEDMKKEKNQIQVSTKDYAIKNDEADQYWDVDLDSEIKKELGEEAKGEKQDSPDKEEVQATLTEFCNMVINVQKGDRDETVKLIQFMKSSFKNNILLTNTIDALLLISNRDPKAIKQLPMLVYFCLILEKVIEMSILKESIQVKKKQESSKGRQMSKKERNLLAAGGLQRIHTKDNEDIKDEDEDEYLDNNYEIDQNTRTIVLLIQAWLDVLPKLFQKRFNHVDEINDLKFSLRRALEFTIKFQKQQGFDQDKWVMKNEEHAKKVSVIITGIVLVMKANFDHMGILANELGGFDADKVQYVISFLRDYVSVFGKQVQDKNSNFGATALSTIKSMAVEIASATTGKKDSLQTSEQLFTAFDKDKSGYIDFNEFMDLCKYMGITMSRSDMMALFSKSDRDESNQINQVEFREAIVSLRTQVAQQTLEKLGIAQEDLLKGFIFGIIYLILIFVFIFLGIAAFSDDSSFSSIVNSLMPMAAGLRLGSLNNPKVSELLDKLKDAIKKLFDQLKP